MVKYSSVKNIYFFCAVLTSICFIACLEITEDPKTTESIEVPLEVEVTPIPQELQVEEVTPVPPKKSSVELNEDTKKNDDAKNLSVLINKHFLSGNNNFDVGKYQEAIKDYTEVIKIDSGFYKAYHNRGVVYDLLGDLDKSIADYTSAIMLYPTYDQAYYNRARVYGRTGQSHKAIEDYTQAIAINPQNQGAYHNRGIIFAERGQIEKALSDLSRAIELNPQDGIAYYNRGKMYQVFGMNEESKADLQKSQELLSNQQE